MATFEVTRGVDTIEDTVFDVDPVVDTANPFGDYCVIKMDDSEGEKFAQYRRGTRVDVSISEDGTTNDRFTGYVVERRETEQDGADVLEVEAYSFDQFLRRNNVTNDQKGNNISEALEDIITNDTPVEYLAANIDVGDEQELTRSYQGEAVETVLRDLAFKSNNEDFGVNDDLEFFFRERETVHIDRGIDNTQWFNYDIPELGKETINEVEVWFDDGEESVIVDDGTDKLDLQDSLGLADPGTQRAELNRPLITDINDAEDEGRKYLQFRNSTLSGTVTTFGLFDAEPGDTIDIEIQPRGIDEEFVIAAIEYRWGVDETILTIVEKRGDVDDILSELNESVQRVEMEGANRDAPKNRITTTDAAAIVSISDDFEIENENVVFVDSGETLEVNSGETVGATTVENAGSVDNAGSLETTQSLNVGNSDRRFVNDGRRAVRDTWIGGDAPDISTLVVGDDGSGLSRSNSEMRNQTNSVSVSKSLPDSKTVEFTATIEQAGVQEVGLETVDGRLITRGVFDDPVDLSGEIVLTLSVTDDGDISRGVITNDGQTAVRDVLADNGPTLPNAYAYGSDGTAVSEADTALGNEIVEVSLDEIEIQSADTNAEFDAIYSQELNTPLRITGNQLELKQSCFLIEAEDADLEGSNDVITGDIYSGGEAVTNSDLGEAMETTFSIDYAMPSGSWGVFFRGTQASDDGSDTRVKIEVDGDVAFDQLPALGVEEPGWQIIEPDDILNKKTITGSTTVRVEVDNVQDDDIIIDLFGLFDGRPPFSYNFEDVDLSTVSRQHLNGPELFPNRQTADFETATFRKNIRQGRFNSTWNDVSNDQYIQVNGERFNNSETGSFEFDTGTEEFDTTIQLSRFPVDTDPQEETPRFGYNGQAISLWELFIDPDEPRTDDIGKTLARGVVQPDTITGETLREAGLKSDETLLTRHELAEFEVLAGQRISSSESTSFSGSN